MRIQIESRPAESRVLRLSRWPVPAGVFCAMGLLAAGALQAAPLVPTPGPALDRNQNLVLNGSFEDDYTGGFHYWATGTTLAGYAPIQDWTSQGGTQAYAWRGSTAGYAPGSHGNALLYFGNQFATSLSPQPLFNPDGTVTFASPPTITANPGYTPAVTLKQTVSGLTPGYIYALSFWTTGEAANSAGYGHDGIFGLDVTGYDTTYLACPDAAANSIFGANNHTYRFEFAATAASMEFKFTNWGHFFLNVNGQMVPTTELIMDDVIVNLVKVPEPATAGLLLLGSLVMLPRRRDHLNP